MEFDIVNKKSEFKLGNILSIFKLPGIDREIALFTISFYEKDDDTLNIAYINKDKDAYIILMSPDGDKYNEKIVCKLRDKKHIIIICGHYEGFDERIRSLCDAEISIGDFVLTGGEIPATAIVDSVVRLIPGVIDEESLVSESFTDNRLDYPNYTKPRVYRGMEVPEVLVSGNHEEIDKYREKIRLERTKDRRPDLLGDD